MDKLGYTAGYTTSGWYNKLFYFYFLFILSQIQSQFLILVFMALYLYTAAEQLFCYHEMIIELMFRQLRFLERVLCYHEVIIELMFREIKNSRMCVLLFVLNDSSVQTMELMFENFQIVMSLTI